MKIVTAAQMQALDGRTILEARITGSTLMTNAGAGVVAAMERTFGAPAGKRVAVVCGKGNNGGDGFVVARLLRQKRARVQAILLASPADLTGDARTMYRRFVSAGGSAVVHRNSSVERLRSILGTSDLIVDALLGTGLSVPVSGTYKAAIEMINEANRPVTSIDLPSGIHADTGDVLGTAVRARLTVTLGLPKLGLYVGPGIDHAGEIRIVDIGIPAPYRESVQSHVSLITAEKVRSILPARIPSAHKGTYGHASIIAGSVGKSGSAALAAKAALRAGAGLVTVATPASVNDVLETKLLEAMTVPMPETKARTLARSGLDRLMEFINVRSAVAIGPGLTTHPETVELIQTLVRQLDKPSVLDADALNALVGRTSLLAECKVPPILTPHPGEMARLEQEATPQAINADRIGIASRFAQGFGVILVLKGARTVVAHPSGSVAICPTGNPGMATAGTGDALTGIIVGLLAQGVPPWEAAYAGTYIHGLAGDLASTAMGQTGLIAGDLVDGIPHAMTAILTTPAASPPPTSQSHANPRDAKT